MQKVDVAQLDTRRLNELQPFPTQARYFGDLDDHALLVLAGDIERNGLRQPIEILPAGNRAGYVADTILKGHQRRLALQRLGYTETDVVVRYDLAEADAETIEQEFLEDNQNRRQLDPLARARIAARLFEIERLSTDEPGELRDRVGKTIGMSGRHVDRYLSVLCTPEAVQAAFQHGQISLKVAVQVAGLSSTKQKALAKRIVSGEDPKTVVSAYLAPSSTRSRNADETFATFVRALERGSADVDVARITRSLKRRNLTQLKKARRLLDKLIADAEATPKTRRQSSAYFDGEWLS